MRNLFIFILCTVLAGCMVAKINDPFSPDLYQKRSEHPENGLVCDTSPRPEIMCTMEYDPVCVSQQVQCVMAPCPPIEKTFGNACEARAAGFLKFRKGACVGNLPINS